MTLVNTQLHIFIVFKEVLHLLCNLEGKKSKPVSFEWKSLSSMDTVAIIQPHNSVAGLLVPYENSSLMRKSDFFESSRIISRKLQNIKIISRFIDY